MVIHIFNQNHLINNSWTKIQFPVRSCNGYLLLLFLVIFESSKTRYFVHVKRT